jgi:hypothetical protein
MTTLVRGVLILVGLSLGTATGVYGTKAAHFAWNMADIERAEVYALWRQRASQSCDPDTFFASYLASYPTICIPTPARDLPPGHVIAASDLVEVALPIDFVSPKVVRDPVGRTVRAKLLAHEFVRGERLEASP